MSAATQTFRDAAEGLVTLATMPAAGHWLRRRAWDARALDVDLKGRVCVVTGGSQGLGRAIAHGLAVRNATVVIVCRDAQRGELARHALVAATGNELISVEPADLASIASVRSLAARIAANTHRVDVLVNNAGAVFDAPARSVDGHALTFATNVLGAFHLTALLALLLRAAAPSRVVDVGSAAQHLQRLDVDALAGVAWPYLGDVAYAQSKRALFELSSRWSERLAPHGVIVRCMHPGLAATPGTARTFPRYHALLAPALRDLDQGADTALWLAVCDAPTTPNALYFDRAARAAHTVPWTRCEPAEVDRLWSLCASLCDLAPDAVGR